MFDSRYVAETSTVAYTASVIAIPAAAPADSRRISVRAAEKALKEEEEQRLMKILQDQLRFENTLAKEVATHKKTLNFFYNEAEALMAREWNEEDAYDDFTLSPYVVPFPLPEKQMDFGLPENYHQNNSDNSTYQHYRVLKSNLYRAPLARVCRPEEEVPQCSCSVQEGCDNQCQNRSLFM